ncbi:MAG: archaetidylserine decarboxylase [Myxococcota bacterium]
MTTEAGDDRATLGVASRALLGLLHLLPRNAISRAMGWLASRRLPAPLQRLELELFVRLAGIDRSEFARPLESYPSLQQLFTRALAPGARPLEGGEEILVSPCDGAWGTSGGIERGRLLQVKGRPYRVADLIGDEHLAERYEGGQFATLYLSPRDYHRFHTPAAGRITRLVYRPGSLWPVNAIGLQGIDGLFARNERICAFLEVDDPARARGGVGSAPIAMVAVGATMVGSVRLAFDAMATNRPGAEPEDRELGAQAPVFARGAEWGHFEFGSTIVLLVPPDRFRLEPRPVGTPLRLGRAIGRILPSA